MSLVGGHGMREPAHTVCKHCNKARTHEPQVNLDMNKDKLVSCTSTGRTISSLESLTTTTTNPTKAIEENLPQHCSIVQEWGVLSSICCLCGCGAERPSAAVQGRPVPALCTRTALRHSAVLAGAELCL